ncbi:MAG: hypothetical protein SPH43_00435, partial [Candidatus Enteromonas sp.]|nr:hypothetical protein [Candidatus Enteromonas sp.]
YYHCKGARAHKCDTRRLLKEDVENTAALLILDSHKEKKVIKEVADRIYRAQGQDFTKLSRLKSQLTNAQTQIGNFEKAIGMGVITETTKSALLRLEGEESDLEKRIRREQITNRRCTKAEIVASLEILGGYLSENDLQKRALFETFVDKIVAYKDGKIVVNVDVFGTKAKIESIDGVVNGVRTEKIVLRQSVHRLPSGSFFRVRKIPLLLKKEGDIGSKST